MKLDLKEPLKEKSGLTVSFCFESFDPCLSRKCEFEESDAAKFFLQYCKVFYIQLIPLF